MGIYDRDYLQDGRRGGGGGFGGGFGGASGVARGFRFDRFSFNTWLIIINVAVFLIGNVFLGTTLAYEKLGTSWVLGVTPAQQESAIADLQNPVPTGQGYKIPLYEKPPVGADGRPAPAVNVIGFENYRSMPVIQSWFHFSTARGFLGWEVWRLISFQFLHANFLHLFFNMFGLYVFGGVVEQYLGAKRYAAFYLVCGIAGALLYLILNMAGQLGIRLPGSLDVDIFTPLVGASAGVFGVIMACAKIMPEARIQLLFPPIPLKMRTLAYGYVGLAAFNLFFLQGANQGGDAAHIGGALAGFYFIRNMHLLRDFFDVLGNSNLPKGGRASGKGRRGKRSEVDRILSKVSAQGIHSLTDKEKAVLRKATEAGEG